MKRPSKKDIKAAIDQLKDKAPNPSKFVDPTGKLTPKKSSQRIRKKGI